LLWKDIYENHVFGNLRKSKEICLLRPIWFRFLCYLCFEYKRTSEENICR